MESAGTTYFSDDVKNAMIKATNYKYYFHYNFRVSIILR